MCWGRYGKRLVEQANQSARLGGLAGLGRTTLEAFDPTDVVHQRPISETCSVLSIQDGQCCLGRDNRVGRLNGLQVLDVPTFCMSLCRPTNFWTALALSSVSACARSLARDYGCVYN